MPGIPGRKDFQVKIRGYRVELEEIEEELRSCGRVRQAAVVYKQSEGPDGCLVAYVTGDCKTGLSMRCLRQALKAKLPDFMMPSVFVVLEDFPVTPTGKIDRQALPDPGRSRPALDHPLVAPGNSIEIRLAGIWAEALSIGEIGVNDDFLELGDHLLIAARIVTKVNEIFGIDLSLRSLLDVSTVAGLAGVVASLCASKRPPAAQTLPAAKVESGKI